MTSTVDSVINALEMESYPDPTRDNARIAGTGGFSAADSCPNRARSDNTRIAGAANFIMIYPNAQSNKKGSPLYPPFDVTHIPPPPTMSHFWQYPEYRTLPLGMKRFSKLDKILYGTQQNRPCCEQDSSTPSMAIE